MADALVVQQLRKSYGRTVVLDGVDLVVPNGSIAAVLGPSGGGKTTLLRLIAGFDQPDSGVISIDGQVVASPTINVPAERRRVGVVPQEGALFPHLDVAGNVGFGLPRGPQRAERIAEVLELVGLPGVQRKKPHQLSGGQQHRVALARAIAPHPTLVVLDEPFSSLDAGLRAQVREEVLVALQTARTTAIVVTHDQQEALSIADVVAVLLDGTIAQCADPATLYESPATLAVATFVGEATVLDGVVHNGLVRCALGELTMRPGGPTEGPAKVLVRPEQIDIDAAASNTGTGTGTATVVARAFFGHDGMVRVQLADGSSVAARVHAARLPARQSHIALRVNSPVSVFSAEQATSSLTLHLPLRE